MSSMGLLLSMLIFMVQCNLCLASKHKSNEHTENGPSSPLDHAPPTAALYIRHTDEPNEPIYLSDWLWQMLKQSGHAHKHGSHSSEHGTNQKSSNQTAFLIKEEGKTDEPIILNSWFQKLLLNSKSDSLNGIDINSQTAAFVNSSHPSHIGVPEPIFVSDWFSKYLANPTSLSDQNTYNKSAAFFIRNPGKPEEVIYLNDWFWNLLRFRN